MVRLTRLIALSNSLAFRAILLATLVNVGLVAAIYAPYNGDDQKAAADPQHDRVRPTIGAKSPEERTADYTYWLTACTLVLAVSTVGLWIVTWRAARGQSRDMQESIRHSEAASKAAAASVDLAREALTGLDRPYVFLVIEEHTIPDGVTFGDLVRRGNELTITYRYKNFGKSPAIIRETAFLTKLYRHYDPMQPVKRQASNYTSQAKSRSWVIAGGEASNPVRQKVDLTANPQIIAFLKPKTEGNYIHPSEVRDPAEQPHIAIHDRVRYEDTIGNTYMLYVGYAFMGTAFHLFHHEHETYTRYQNTQT